MTELIFVIENDPDGGYVAKALGQSIFTQAENWEELRRQVRDAVNCHFDEADKPKIIRLHLVTEEVIAA